VLSGLSTFVQPLTIGNTPYLTTYSIMIGTNDLGLGISPSTTYANIQSICSTVRSYGVANVAVFTILPASPYGSESQRQVLNGLIRSGGACLYTILDVGNDLTIGQAGQNANPTYYQSDMIHPTAAGDTIIGVNYYLPFLQYLKFH